MCAHLEAELQKINGAKRKLGTTCPSFELPAQGMASLQRDGSRLFFFFSFQHELLLRAPEVLYWSFADVLIPVTNSSEAGCTVNLETAPPG